MSAQTAELYDISTDQVEFKYISALDAVEKGSRESVIKLVDDFFNPALNFEKSFQDEIRQIDLPEPPNETDSEALYRGVITFGEHKSVAFQSLQKWEGIVQEVNEDYFVAKLIDLTSGLTDEVAEFPLEEISEDDKKLVEPGAVFYWNIGYQISQSKQKRRTSLIRFRRLPAWRQKDLEQGKTAADKIAKLLGL